MRAGVAVRTAGGWMAERVEELWLAGRGAGRTVACRAAANAAAASIVVRTPSAAAAGLFTRVDPAGGDSTGRGARRGRPKDTPVQSRGRSGGGAEAWKSAKN